MKTFIDRHYRTIRRWRFLYGWAKDAYTRMQCSRRAEEWRARGFRGAKLDICGGRNPLNPGEYLNVDVVPLPKVDIVFDIRGRFPFEDGTIAEIFSAATLEHFRRHDQEHILREFFRVLRPGGILRVSTPDLGAIARGILAGEDLAVINQHLFGKYKSEETEDYDLHRWMFPAEAMMELLRAIGFTATERIPMDIGLHDPRYNFLIRAKKPMER
jgi:predicted SAM-dependent methyltransferase